MATSAIARMRAHGGFPAIHDRTDKRIQTAERNSSRRKNAGILPAQLQGQGAACASGQRDVVRGFGIGRYVGHASPFGGSGGY